MTLTDLLAEHGAASWDKQMCLAMLIGDYGWSLDVKRGEIMFGDALTFPAQLLGSEADAAETWLWAWANEASHLPPELVAASQQLQDFGRQNAVPELTTPEVSLDDVNGHLLSMIASGQCGADAYYRGPYEGGAAFLLLTAPEAKRFADPTPTHFIRIFMEFISAFSCPHRPALEAYARYKDYAFKEQADGSLLLTSPAGDAITATFDVLGRVKDFSATLTKKSFDGTDPVPAKKPWWKLGG